MRYSCSCLLYTSVREEIQEEAQEEAEHEEAPVQDRIEENVEEIVQDVEDVQPEPAETLNEQSVQTEENLREDTEENHRESKFSKITKIISGPRRQDNKKTENSFEPIKKRNDEEENLEIGDVNPYTGHEYQTNSVRMHPKRIGYVQVYDRKEHKWTDMTEWAFLGMEERKRAMLGKEYEPPIYLD